MTDTTTDRIEQIVIEQLADADGGGWGWDVFGREVESGQAPTLAACMTSLNEYLQANGHLS